MQNLYWCSTGKNSIQPVPPDCLERPVFSSVKWILQKLRSLCCFYTAGYLLRSCISQSHNIGFWQHTQAVVLPMYKTVNECDGQLSVWADFCNPSLLMLQKVCRTRVAFQHLSHSITSLLFLNYHHHGETSAQIHSSRDICSEKSTAG